MSNEETPRSSPEASTNPVDAAPPGTPVETHDGLTGVVGDSAQCEGVVRVQLDGDPPGCLRD